MKNSNLALVCLFVVVLVAPSALMAAAFSFSDNFEDGDMEDVPLVVGGEMATH